MGEQFRRQGIKNYFQYILGSTLLAEADTIRVVSEKIKTDVECLFKNTKNKPFIHVLPVFVDIKEIQKKVLAAKSLNFENYFPVVLNVSRLEKEKNVSLAIRSFAKLLKRCDRALFVIAGEGSKRKELESLVKYLGVQERVMFVGFQNDLSSLYKSSHVLLSTSLYEGFGMSILEAASVGLPIISTNVGIAREIGATIVSYDAGEIAMRLAKVGEDEVSYRLEDFFITIDDYCKRFKETFSL